MPHAQASHSFEGAVVHRILVVEDEIETANALRSVLEAHHFEVIVAREGGQAHSAFVMRKPDFVILDLLLPGESGFEICERFKFSDRQVPVMVLSAIDLADSVQLARRVGADEYLVKPFDPELLVHSIRETAERVWRRHHGLGEVEDQRIKFSCPCGKRFKVSPSHRGKTLTCPNCGEPLTVPRYA